MAGNYMDAPASRLAYDRDGSIGVVVSAAGAITTLTAADLRSLNDEGEGAPTFATKARLAIIFSEPIDIKAVFLALSANTEATIETSKDSTTGIDGTWTAQVASAAYGRDVRPNYRIASQITPMIAGSDSNEVRAVRISFALNTTISFRALHIYGDISSSATDDRLSFRQVASDVEVGPTHFDWGNVPRASSADKTFRIKNLSADMTAEAVEVYAEGLTPGVPSVPSMLLLSLDGTTFTPSVNLGDLAPGDVSGTITVRRVIPSNAQVSVWSARLVADADNWV